MADHARTRRPKEFNRLMRALVRKMSELHNDVAVAYAMDKTKRYFDESESREPKTAAVEEWRRAKDEFERMPFEQQHAWQEKIEKE